MGTSLAAFLRHWTLRTASDTTFALVWYYCDTKRGHFATTTIFGKNMIDQTSPHGKRDYAALLLATRLGIRSGDISSMTFKELDFDRSSILLTQHKTGIAMEFPMVPDVKTALERYLQEERADNESPYVFLRIIPPYNHISVQAITNTILK